MIIMLKFRLLCMEKQKIEFTNWFRLFEFLKIIQQACIKVD